MLVLREHCGFSFRPIYSLVSGSALQRIFAGFFYKNSLLLSLIWQNATGLLETYEMSPFFYSNTAVCFRP